MIPSALYPNLPYCARCDDRTERDAQGVCLVCRRLPGAAPWWRTAHPPYGALAAEENNDG
jgi:hypothetical protein